MLDEVEARINTHEEICALRYKDLLDAQERQNKAIANMQGDIEKLLTVMNMGFGMWKLVLGAAVVTGIVATLFKFKGE